MRCSYLTLRVAIDLTALLPRPTGVDTYILELVKHLAKIDRENQYTLFVNVGDRRRFDGKLGENMTVRAWSGRPRVSRLAFQQCALPVASALLDFDVIHSPSFLLPLWRGRALHLLTVHDMTFFTRPALHNRLHRSSLFRRAVRMSIRRAHMVNVPSEAVRSDLLRLLPMRELMADPVRRESLVQLGRERAATFRWEDTARLLVSCYEAVNYNRPPDSSHRSFA